jgi:hypothetical protein
MRPSVQPGAVVHKARPIRSDRSWIGNIVGSLVLIVVGGLLLSCLLTIGIWPGEVKLVAPLFCTDAQPDPFVVADTYSPQPGETVTNFSLYCMGPRGDATDHGFLWPFMATAMLNGIVLWLLVTVPDAIRWIRSRAGGGGSGGRPEPVAAPAPTGSTAGPFVD